MWRRVQMKMITDPVRKRTAWIWAISIFYLFSVGWTLLSFVLIYTGTISVNPAQRAYLDSLSTFDLGVSVLIGLLNLSGVVALFVLNRVAVKLFVIALAASVLVALWHAATKGWLQALGGPGFMGTIIGFGISAAVCIYAWKLTKKGILA
jgi:hypothetical protein